MQDFVREFDSVEILTEGYEDGRVELDYLAFNAALRASQAALRLEGLTPTPLGYWDIYLRDSDPIERGATNLDLRQIDLFLWSPKTLAHELTHAQDPRLQGPNSTIHYTDGTYAAVTERDINSTHAALQRTMPRREKIRRAIQKRKLTHEEVRAMLDEQALRRYSAHPLEITAREAERLYSGPPQLATLV